MRLLLVDNGTKHLGQLQAICTRHQLDIVTREEFVESNRKDEAFTNTYDAIILSGSYQSSVMSNLKEFQPELELIRSTQKPLLGICLGFELICYAFGAELERLAGKATGAMVVTPTDEGAKIFQGTDPIRVTEAHRWCVEAEDLPKTLALLAESETGVEAVRHKTRPIYGVQFHPEDFTYASDGKLVFENILAAFQKIKKIPKTTEDLEPAIAR